MNKKSNYAIWAVLLFFSFCKLGDSNLMKKKKTKRGDVINDDTYRSATPLERVSTPDSSQYEQVRAKPPPPPDPSHYQF